MRHKVNNRISSSVVYIGLLFITIHNSIPNKKCIYLLSHHVVFHTFAERFISGESKILSAHARAFINKNMSHASFYERQWENSRCGEEIPAVQTEHHTLHNLHCIGISRYNKYMQFFLGKKMMTDIGKS